MPYFTHRASERKNLDLKPKFSDFRSQGASCWATNTVATIAKSSGWKETTDTISEWSSAECLQTWRIKVWTCSDSRVIYVKSWKTVSAGIQYVIFNWGVQMYCTYLYLFLDITTWSHCHIRWNCASLPSFVLYNHLFVQWTLIKTYWFNHSILSA